MPQYTLFQKLTFFDSRYQIIHHKSRMNIIGIIPARGGSKRIPRKNLKEFHGLPLIAWTIMPALKSCLKRVIVTTDDQEIADAAKQYGAEVPFLRPAELANDTTGIEPVLRHTIESLEAQGEKIDGIALLMPTYPLRSSEDINAAIEHFITSKADSVISVIPATANRNPYWILKRNEDNQVVLFNGDPLTMIPTRSQDLPKTYSRNDMIYVLKKENLYQSTSNLYGNTQEFFEMEPFFEADINTEEDWFITFQKMIIMQQRQNEKPSTQE